MIDNAVGQHLSSIMPGVEPLTLLTRRTTEPGFADRRTALHTTINTPTVTAVDTSLLYVGQSVRSSSLPPPSKTALILSIDSGTQVTLTHNAIETSAVAVMDFADPGVSILARRKPVSLQMLVLAGAQLDQTWLTWQGYAPPDHLVSPPIAKLMATAGGALVLGTTYYYVITSITGNGESLAGAEMSFTASSAAQSVTLTWELVLWATGYKVYRSLASGVYATPALVTTINAPSILTCSDVGVSLSTGAPPTVTPTSTIVPPKYQDRVIDEDGVSYEVRKADGKLLLSVYDLLSLGDR